MADTGLMREDGVAGTEEEGVNGLDGDGEGVNGWDDCEDGVNSLEGDRENDLEDGVPGF